MTLTVGSDTYATLAEADAYASAKGWAASAWADLADAVREQRLRDAAEYLDLSYSWKGIISSVSQAMAWPRAGVIDKEGREIATDAYPSRLKSAQIELAYLNTAGLVANDDSGKVTALSAGSVSLTFKDGQSATEAGKYRSIDRLLVGLYKSRAGKARTVRLSKS